MNEIETILQSLECPFTWGMDEIDLSCNGEYNRNKQYQFFPVVELMHDIMSLYITTRKEEDFQIILTKIEKCEESIECFKNNAHSEISTVAVSNILQATMAHVLYKFKKFDEELFDKLKEINIESDKDKSTINACKSIAWSKYNVQAAIDFIQKAVNGNRNCDFYYFTLAKELRRVRRDKHISIKPSPKEIECFKKSYDIANNLYCGVFLAQLYREIGDCKNAKRMYNSIFNNEPESSIVLLRLALGFIKFKEFKKAKSCLDKVATMCPNHELYLHYCGIFHQDQGHLKEAIPFLEKAIAVKSKPFAIEKQYLYCKTKIEPLFDTTKHLLKITEKYKDLKNPEIQYFYLELAYSFWCYKSDILEATKTFIEAISMNPKAKILKNYKTNIGIDIQESNVFLDLKVNLLPEIESKILEMDTEKREELERLQNILKKIFNDGCGGP